jgi:arylsulfatase A-like enzyme
MVVCTAHRLTAAGRSLALAFTLLAGAAVRAEEPLRPSFLILITDDQRWDSLGSTGHPFSRTPHLDRLAAGGVTFTNAFVTTAICCVSRASFFTGLYARHHRVGDFATALAPEVLARSFPALLKKAGYRTGCFGKWGIGGEEPKGVFDVWRAWGGQGSFFHAENGEEVHNSEWLARRAEEFLRGVRPGEPFCLTVCYKAPHDPFLPDAESLALYEEEEVAPPRTYTEAHFRAMPEFIRRSEGRKRLLARHPDPAAYQRFVKQYLRCIAGVDRSAGRILALLEELGLAPSTVVVFTSDHGFFLGEHGLSGKWLMHEESIRIPLIIRWPGLAEARRGARADELVLLLDIAPTLCDLAGVEAPPNDGRSLRPLLEQGSASGWREDFFYEHHYDHGGAIPRTEGVRTRSWKYITYFDVEPPFSELYDLEKDPHEEHNLAGKTEHRERLEALRARHREYARGFPPPALPKSPR